MLTHEGPWPQAPSTKPKPTGPNGLQRPADTGFVTSLRLYMDRQTLSIMKACEVVGVSRRTIYNWIAAGKVEYVRTAGGSIRIFADTLWRDAGTTARSLPANVANIAGRHA